jgi:hypothetical protein
MSFIFLVFYCRCIIVIQRLKCPTKLWNNCQLYHFHLWSYVFPPNVACIFHDLIISVYEYLDLFGTRMSRYNKKKSSKIFPFPNLIHSTKVNVLCNTQQVWRLNCHIQLVWIYYILYTHTLKCQNKNQAPMFIRH